MNSNDIITSVFNESKLLRDISQYDFDQIIRISKIFANSLKDGGKIIVFGNGGSAADAQHFAAELVGRFYKLERKALPAVALTTNNSTITALANDYDYSIVFTRQIEAFGMKGDVAVGISTSGGASSVLGGFKEAKKNGMKAIFLTGRSGGKIYEELKNNIDETIFIPSDNTGRIQEVHITMLHLFCSLIEYELFGKT